MMRIGMVSKFHAADGLCIRANAVLSGLIEKGHDVHAFTQSQEVVGLPKEKIHRYPAVQLNEHFSIDSLSAAKMISQKCREYKIDVLHIQMNSGTTEFLLPYFRKALPPLAITYHLAYAGGGSFYTTLFAVLWKASLWAAKKYDEIILVDPSQEPYFLDAGVPKDRISVVRNGVDTNTFKPLTRGDDDDFVDFVFVGRLSYDKGVHLLLDAFSEYHRENRMSRLTLIGDGMLKSRIDGCTDDGSIRWLGTIGHEKIPGVLQQMDAFVIPQNIGGLGLSVMEGMSCGLPVVTTAIGETIRLLADDEGVLIKPDDKGSLVEALRYIGEDKNRRKSMGNRCRSKILTDYSWDSQIQGIERAYERAMSRPMH
jgi:glycosyltransferase involved in cell wall biosynthesis